MLIYTLRDAKVSKRIAKNCIEDFTELLRSSLHLNFKMYEGKSMHIVCLDGHENFFRCIIVQEAYANIPYKQQKKYLNFTSNTIIGNTLKCIFQEELSIAWTSTNYSELEKLPLRSEKSYPNLLLICYGKDENV